MKPPPFRYVRAGSLADALSALASEGDEARLLAGGQSLIAMMNLRLVRPSALVDVNGVSELDYIRADDATLTVGALTRLSAAEASQEIAGACPLMSEAIGHIAHRPIRNRGTVGGNLSHADPSSELPAVALAVDAQMVVQKNGSVRRVAADDFFVGALTTSMAPDEALTAIEVPRAPGGQGWSFMEVSPRKGDYALVGVAVTLSVEDGRCTACRVVYTGNGDRARRIPEAEGAVVGEAAGAATFEPPVQPPAGTSSRIPISTRASSTAETSLRRSPGAHSRRPPHAANRRADHEQGASHRHRERQAVRTHRRAPPPAVRLHPRGHRPHRDPRRLRARHLRHLHGADERRHRAVVPHLRGAGARGRDHHRRVSRHPDQHAPAAGGVLGAPRAPVRLLYPAMLLTAKELLDANPSPSREEIQEAISGNLCRCTGYQTIVEAVETAAARIRGEGQ